MKVEKDKIETIEEPQEEKKGTPRYQRTIVAKETEPAIADLETEEIMDTHLALERILNGIEELKKALV